MLLRNRLYAGIVDVREHACAPSEAVSNRGQ